MGSCKIEDKRFKMDSFNFATIKLLSKQLLTFFYSSYSLELFSLFDMYSIGYDGC